MAVTTTAAVMLAMTATASTRASRRPRGDIWLADTANTTAARDWSVVKAKVAADLNALKADIAHAKHDRDVKRIENRAERLESDAAFAIDYAIASVEQARLAVLDAVDGRLAAEEAKKA